MTRKQEQRLAKFREVTRRGSCYPAIWNPDQYPQAWDLA